MHRTAVILAAIVFSLSSASSLAREGKSTVNDDIVVTHYDSIVMEQGKWKVFPIFRIKNTGSRPYKDVQLRYDTPRGLSDVGKTDKLGRSRIKKDWYWERITLLPGQEVPFNPSHKGHVSLSARADQAKTVYGTTYQFRFKDNEGQAYHTTPKRITEFVKVVPFNNDIVVTHYDPIVMEQGKWKVFPKFRIKNTGSRPYKDVQLRYDTPKGLSDEGKTDELALSYIKKDWYWERITLLPGQEVPFNPSHKGHVSLSARADQAKTVYGTNFHLRFKDDKNQWYRTPSRKIEEFIKVIPFNDEVVITHYTPVQIEQGQSKVFPVFRIKNTGSRPYRDIQLRYETPVGLSREGKTDKLALSYIKKDWYWERITLLPGQEVTFNPSHKSHVSLSARADQAETVYGTKFHFRFRDDANQWYRTPPRKIEQFAYVSSSGEKISPKIYSHATIPDANQTYPEAGKAGEPSSKQLETLRNRLGREIDRLQTIVHPSQLEELKRIRDEMRESDETSALSPSRQGTAPGGTPRVANASKGTLLARIGDQIAKKTQSTLEQQYAGNAKWLVFLGAGAFDIIDVAIYIDLADYMGLTGEGRGDGSNEGEQWVTVWVDGSAGLEASLLPVSLGVAKLSFDPAEPDPRRRYRLSLGSGTLPGFSIKLVERRTGDNGPTWGDISFGTLAVSASLVNVSANLARFEIKKSVLQNLVESSFSRESAFLGPAALNLAAARIVTAMVKRDTVTGELRIVADGARKFSSSDDGPVADRQYVDAAFTRIHGGMDIDGDGFGDLKFPVVASVGTLPIAGHNTTVEFKNIGNNTSNFFVKVKEVPSGWIVWPLDGGNRLGDKKFDIANLAPGSTAKTMWGIGASITAPAVARIRFRVYHDGILPISAPWLGNEYLDEIDLVLHKQLLPASK